MLTQNYTPEINNPGYGTVRREKYRIIIPRNNYENFDYLPGFNDFLVDTDLYHPSVKHIILERLDENNENFCYFSKGIAVIDNQTF